MGMYPTSYIGLSIAKIRNDRKLLQYQVANPIGWYSTKLSQIETGALMPTYLDLLNLASVFELSVQDIVGDDCIGNYK